MSRFSAVIGGSKKEETTTVNTELVTYLGKNGNYSEPAPFQTLSFTCETDCRVIVNDETDIFLPAGANLSFESGELKITSFKIREKGVKYHWLACI